MDQIKEAKKVVEKVGGVAQLEWFFQMVIGCDEYDRIGLPIISHKNPSDREVRDLILAFCDSFLVMKSAGLICKEQEEMAKETLGHKFLNLTTNHLKN